MKDLVIGMGEALWDVLPDGKKSEALLPTSRITFHSSGFRASL